MNINVCIVTGACWWEEQQAVKYQSTESDLLG